MSLRWVLRSFGAALFIAAIVWVIHFFLFTHTGARLLHTNVRQLSEYLKSLGPLAYILGIAAVVLQTALFPFVPFFVIAGANVLAFGLVRGFAINYMFAVIGAVVSFLFARYMGHDWVERKLNRHPVAQAFNRRMESHGFVYVFLGRLVPIIPSSAINWGGGVTKVRFRAFLFGTMLGKFPIVLLESFIGNDLMHLRHNRGRLTVLLFIFIGLILLGGWLKKKLTAKSECHGDEVRK